MLEANNIQGDFLEYKERPLVRQDDELYYGDLSDKYHVYMRILNEKDVGDVSVPDKIMIQLFAKGNKMPEKQTVSSGFADAMETADAWLTRYNK